MRNQNASQSSSMIEIGYREKPRKRGDQRKINAAVVWYKQIFAEEIRVTVELTALFNSFSSPSLHATIKQTDIHLIQQRTRNVQPKKDLCTLHSFQNEAVNALEFS